MASHSQLELCSPFPTTCCNFIPIQTSGKVGNELTSLHASSRPGILVLINDADWELEGEATYALQPNDNILFVSTLHGG